MIVIKNSISIELRNAKFLRLALNCGLSLTEFSRKILIELNDIFPTEAFEDYENPKGVKAAFNRALRNLKAGRVKTKI